MCKHWIAANQVIYTLKTHNYEAYIVGGAVRDRLLKRRISDVDIVTTASANEVQSIFTKTFRMSNEYETVIVRQNQEHLEVTTIRGQTIEDDLHLRDLTINSIAQDEQERVIDPTGGIIDLHERRLCSYQPYERMTEDPLRMLRVYRFVSELGFSVDVKLEETIIQNAKQIERVAVERVIKEWIKLLKGNERNLALTKITTSQLYPFLPGLHLTEQTINEIKKLPSLQNESELVVWTAYCLCLDGMDIPLKRLALSNDLQKGIKSRLCYFKSRKKEQWTPYTLYKGTFDVAKDVEKLRVFFGLNSQPDDVLLKMWNELPIYQKSDLAITGNDLLKVKAPGAWMKEELDWAERAVICKQHENIADDLLTALERRRRG